MRTPTLSKTAFRWAVAGLAVAAFALRLWGLTERGFSHPENFVPGVDLPDWTLIKDRSTLVGLAEGQLRDGHPPGWFVLMFAWTKLFGASLFQLRLPSVICGALGVWVIACIARREGGRWAALFAALLLALHGYHVYWSQAARMYALLSLLGLLSSLCLLRVQEDGKRSSHVAYVVTIALLLWTQMFGWLLVLGQLAWCAIGSVRGRPWIALRSQAVAIALSAPALQLAAFQANPEWEWHEPAIEYFEFGYLFLTRHPFFGEAPFALHGPWLVVLCGALILAGSFVRPGALPRKAVHEADRRTALNGPTWHVWIDLAIAVLVGLCMLALARFVYWERPAVAKSTLYALAVYPLAVVLGALFTAPLADRITQHTADPERPTNGGPTLSFVLATVPFIVVYAFSELVQGILVARGTTAFLPFLILAVAGGVARVWSVSAPFGAALALLVTGLFVTALPYHRAAASCPQDFRGLALELEERFATGDRVLVRNDTMHPPLYFYWQNEFDRLVPTDHAESVANASPGTRFWLVHIHEQPVWPELLGAVEGAGWRRTDTVVRPGIEAWLYER